MEKLNVKLVALALASVAGILSLICAAIIAIGGETALKALGTIFHGIDLTAITKTMSFGSVVFGLIEAVIIGAIAGALFAWLYNYFGEKIK